MCRKQSQPLVFVCKFQDTLVCEEYTDPDQIPHHLSLHPIIINPHSSILFYKNEIFQWIFVFSSVPNKIFINTEIIVTSEF